jgi:riboflavin kinase, archaea type
MQFRGQVVSGIGQGAQFLALDWVAAQLRQHLGLTPYPGTLNLRVSAAIRESLFQRRQEFLRIVGPHADPASPDCPGYLKEVTLRANGRDSESAYLILPEKSMYQDVLEIIAAVSLRDDLSLSDGVTVEVALELD